MKPFYLALILLISTSVSAQSWQKKSVIKGAVCSDLIATPSGKIITISTDGIYASTDNAENWAKISSDMDNDLSTYQNDVEPEALRMSNDTIYAYFRSKLYRSTNDGVNWVSVNTSTVRPAYETTFGIKNSNLFLTKFDYNTKLSTIYISKDAGLSWSVADTITGTVNIFTHNSELYLWGYKGELWTIKNPLLKKLDANNKIISMNTAGLPVNTDIRGMGAAGNNLILMIPEYNQSSTIIATKLYGFNGTNWVLGTQFTENYSKLYSVDEFCFQPFFNSSKVLRTKDGINWTNVTITSLYGYYASIRKINATTTLAASRAGIFEIDSNFNRVQKSNGLFAPSLGDMLSFNNKLFINSTEFGVYSSSDNALSFSEVQITNERTGSILKASNNSIYVYNSYLGPKDKIFLSSDGSAWDTLVMPAGNFSSRQILSVSDNGIWLCFTESNIKYYKFYNDVAKNWTDVSSVVPSNASYFNTYRSTAGNMVVVNNYYENNIKKTAVYQIENNANVWKSLKHTLGDVWYENTSVHNNNFYFLKNTYNKPDSLFKIKNDSLVFEKIIKYGSFKFYTDNFYESFFYKGNEIYCLGFDSLQQNNITMIRSIDGGNTWEAFNNGLGAGTQVKSLYFGTNLLASTSKGLYEYGNSTSYVPSAKQIDFELYPNPSTGFVKINTQNDETFQFEIYSTNGMLVAKGFHTRNKEIDLTTLKAGIYIMKIQTANASSANRLVIR